jgi:hypothetical protein
VNVTGFEEFQLLIAEYLNDPSSSPYGSNINCWDVSLVSFDCTYLTLYIYMTSFLSDIRYIIILYL